MAPTSQDNEKIRLSRKPANMIRCSEYGATGCTVHSSDIDPLHQVNAVKMSTTLYTQYPAADPLSNPPQYAAASCVKFLFPSKPRHTYGVPPPPPYSPQPLTGSKKTKWNPFSRKHSSAPVNPRGREAEMIDPEDRAW